MRAFVTGASGILGTDIVKQFEQLNWEVLGFNSQNLDITNYSSVKNQVMDFKPDVLIHSAALTNVDLCEDEKNTAIAINILATQNMARAAARANARLVYISSCGVYGDGQTRPYNELDDTNPINYHHFTKLQGETRVKEYHNDYLIIRPGWLFGGTQQHKKNFVEARRKEAIGKASLKSAADKKGSPTYTHDLAKQLMLLIEMEMAGTFNIVNEDCATRFDYVKEIVRLFNFDTLVEPVNSNSFPRKANMPNNECLDNLHLNLKKFNIMRSWKDALQEYINITYS